ncbi:hypothetical protein HMPREF9621_02843 [Cutibacterium modestum HL037PA2]|nr:hypothetical protein HMPREF9621_02843 [Cutibacterium modestum HL037PA2]
MGWLGHGKSPKIPFQQELRHRCDLALREPGFLFTGWERRGGERG